MVLQRKRGREKESTIVNMKDKIIIVCLMVVLGFVCMKDGKAIVRNVKVAPFVCMEQRNTFVRNVEMLGFVTMGNRKRFARTMVVASCAKPHTVLPENIKSIKDTVCFALSICIQLSLWYRATRQRRTLLQLFLKKSSPMSSGSMTRG